MKKIKKIAALVSVCIMLIGVFAGCGNASNKNSTEKTAAESGNNGIVNLEMYLPVFAATPPADAEVIEAAVNEITEKEIGVHVNINFMPMSDYEVQIPLMLAGDEQVDLLVSDGGSIYQWVAKGYVADFTDAMEKYGKGIVDCLGQEWVKAGQFSGKQHFLPVYADMFGCSGFNMRKDICEKYDIDVSTIKTFADLTPVFEKVHAGEPDMYMIVQDVARTAQPYLFEVDDLGDKLGVLFPVDDPEGTTITNLYASDAYREYCELMRSWYVAGYVEPDILTETENGPTLIKNGKAFGEFYPWKPYVETQETQLCGYEMVVPQLNQPVTSTSLLTGTGWTIGRNCVDIDKTVQLYNLFYTNQDILNILAYGVEGIHYTLDEENKVVINEEAGYNLGMGWLMFDNTSQLIQAGNPSDIYDLYRKMNKEAATSTAMGFHWDFDKVKTEVAACLAIVDQYDFALETGAVDPDVVLPEFLEALNSAGIEKIIEAKQAQFDAWRSEK